MFNSSSGPLIMNVSLPAAPTTTAARGPLELLDRVAVQHRADSQALLPYQIQTLSGQFL